MDFLIKANVLWCVVVIILLTYTNCLLSQWLWEALVWRYTRPDNDHVSFHTFLFFRIWFHQNQNRRQSSTCQTDWKIRLCAPPTPSFFILSAATTALPSPLASTTHSFCITHTLLNNEDEVNPTVTSASQTDFIFTDVLQLHHRPLGIPQTHCVRTLYQAIASAETPLDRHYRTPNSNSGVSELLQGWGSGPISVHLWRVTAIILSTAATVDRKNLVVIWVNSLESMATILFLEYQMGWFCLLFLSTETIAQEKGWARAKWSIVIHWNTRALWWMNEVTFWSCTVQIRQKKQSCAVLCWVCGWKASWLTLAL